MRYRVAFAIPALAAVLAACGARTDAPAAADPPLPLRQLADITLNPAATGVGGPLRMDYESIDPRRRMLFVAYLGADEVVAVDIATNVVAGRVSGLRSVHGILAVPSLHRVYASATGTDEVATIDEGSLAILGRAPAGDYPDGIAYDARDHEIFVSDEHGGTVTVIDTRTGKRTRTIDVGGDAGNTQFDPVAHRAYTDVQARDDVAEIDPATGRVVARHALAGCAHDHGLALDAAHRMAFVACDENAKLLVVDLDDWKVLATFPVGDDPDVLAFDTGLGRLYVASESGVVSVFEERGKTLTTLGSAFLAIEAHTVAVDPMTHRVYFALENAGGKAVIRVMAPEPIGGIQRERG